jgi:hypothetical protein
MAKRKAQRQPRPKKLRLKSSAPVGLTDTQQDELRKLYRPLAHIDGPPPNLGNIERLRRIQLDRLLHIYVEAICHDAQLDNAQSRSRRTIAIRRQVWASIGKLYGHDFSPTDIIRELSKHAPLPAYAADAIRRDYLKVSVH